MPKSKTLPERPKPPSVDEIILDVSRATNDDVVFSSNFSLKDCYEDAEKSMAMEESYLETSGFNVDNQQDGAYHQALQFIRIQAKLETVPTQLDKQFKHLQDLENDISKSIDQLKESSKTLKDK